MNKEKIAIIVLISVAILMGSIITMEYNSKLNSTMTTHEQLMQLTDKWIDDDSFCMYIETRLMNSYNHMEGLHFEQNKEMTQEYIDLLESKQEMYCEDKN